MKKGISKKISIAIFMSFCFAFNMPVYAEKSISELNKERNELKSKSDDTQSSLDETKKEKSGVLQEVEKLDNELMEVQKELNDINSNLEETKKNLSQAETDLKKANKDKENQIEIFKQRIRIMYENGNEGYLELILDAEDISDFLTKLEYAEKIIEFDQKIIDDFEATETRIANDIETIKTKKEEYEKLSVEQEEKKALLDKKIDEKQEMVKKLSEDEKKYLQQIKDLEDADKEIGILIRKEEARLAAKRAMAAVAQTASSYKPRTNSTQQSKPATSSSSTSSSKPATSSSSSSNKTNTQTTPPKNESSSSSGKMAYPVPAYSGASYNDTYGYRNNPISGTDELHTGVDLKATMNSDIVAAASGTVIYAGARGGYGNTVIIDHGDGTSTLYAHNSSLTVNVGDEVSKGQVIAKAGTSGYSTGVHCHFEVRVNGTAVDPTPYLP